MVVLVVVVVVVVIEWQRALLDRELNTNSPRLGLYEKHLKRKRMLAPEQHRNATHAYIFFFIDAGVN